MVHPWTICVVLISFSWLFLPTLATSQTSSITDTVRSLRAIGYPDECENDVPPLGRPLLTQLKHQLRDLIAETLNERGQRARTPQQIRSAVLRHLKELGVGLKPVSPEHQKTPGPESYKYGYIYDIQIQQPEAHKELLVAVTRLQVNPGSDSSIYVFEKAEQRWSLILAQEANDYPTIAGAQAGLKYGVSPPDANGQWFLATTHVNLWCTSMWQGLYYRVLRLGTNPYEPRVLLNQHLGVYLGCDENYKLTVTRAEFEVRHINSQLLDASLLTRVHVQKYVISGDKVTRVPPLAFLPQDFLDEWLRIPWEEAAKWTASGNLEQLRLWHGRLSEDESRFYHSEFEFVQPCSGVPGTSKWLIGVWIDPQNRPEDLPEELFFTVAKRNGAFFVDAIATTRPPGCPGRAYPVSTLGCPKLP